MLIEVASDSSSSVAQSFWFRFWVQFQHYVLPIAAFSAFNDSNSDSSDVEIDSDSSDIDFNSESLFNFWLLSISCFSRSNLLYRYSILYGWCDHNCRNVHNCHNQPQLSQSWSTTIFTTLITNVASFININFVQIMTFQPTFNNPCFTSHNLTMTNCEILWHIIRLSYNCGNFDIGIVTFVKYLKSLLCFMKKK